MSHTHDDESVTGWHDEAHSVVVHAFSITAHPEMVYSYFPRLTFFFVLIQELHWILFIFKATVDVLKKTFFPVITCVLYVVPFLDSFPFFFEGNKTCSAACTVTSKHKLL